ncbi:unnamed protein product [Rotaria sp. Silwood1]|nr:unnamed protein product [Rotaria sp. Silwood1]CAF1528005.1 unnamed protein product [Rotaria sp. Silwood1]CAF1528631.1 unnamed protein product [Rotaria sp. Silwood1]
MNIFLATTTSTTTTCLPICLQWDCWINVTATYPYTSPTVNRNSDGRTSAVTASTNTTASTENLSSSNYLKDLENENFRLKLGLGLGLGASLLATSSLAIGMFIYYSSRLASLQGIPGPKVEGFTHL